MVGGIAFAVLAAKKIPDRYQKLLSLDAVVADRNGKQFERNMTRLQYASRNPRPWRVEITEDQVNGWLVSDLPEKFPGALPAEIQDPRIIFGDGFFELVFKVNRGNVQGVVIAKADVFCTSIPNEIAMKIVDVRAGFVPLPIDPWLERITRSLAKMGVPLYWTTDVGEPVAVFTVPEHLSRRDGRFGAIIDSIEIVSGKLVISGQTKSEQESGRVAKVPSSQVPN